ncbi:MAG: c-type cytochrome [Acidobacteria bacterium]|nr:c-type cytochrome [Acidobacteriota bacterium]MXZ70672.1 c-type cytochrome [Acidobacteriota bacterium]MYD72482.1 c-type cytochrome [Acidobacteriota bacterium]MYJ05680.1 c-type cytochrome [Acidobacteriota bacterium]
MRRRNDPIAQTFVFTAVLATAAGMTLAAHNLPAEPQESSEAQALVNPIEATQESRAAGRQLYVFMCRECHGNSGRGDGDMSHAGGVPSDFTDDVWKHGETDGEIFTVIKEGVTADMQGYANRMNDEQIWHVVNYLRSLGP